MCPGGFDNPSCPAEGERARERERERESERERERESETGKKIVIKSRVYQGDTIQFSHSSKVSQTPHALKKKKKKRERERASR